MVVNLKKSLRLLSAAFCALCLLSSSEAGSESVSSNIVKFPDEAVSRKILDNGLVVLAKRTYPSELVAIDIKIAAAPATEGEYLGSGISHLAEHMVFKGTSSRPAGAIEKEIKSYGGIINGSVSKDMTDYCVILPSEKLPQALSVLSDMLLNAKFDPEEIERERQVILKEVKLNKDEPQSRLINMLYETAYLRHPYRHPVIGYEEPLKALTREDLVRYYNRAYVPNRMAISIVGGIDEEKAAAAVEEAFKLFRAPDYGSYATGREEPPQTVERRADEEIVTSLAYMAMGYHSTGALDDDLFASDVLSMILGRGDNSRLVKRLVKDSGAAYSVSCWNYTPAENGLFVVTAVLDKANLASAEAAVKEEIEKLKSSDVDDGELETAKRMVIADYISGLETFDAQASDMSSSYMMTGNHDFSKNYVRLIQAVTKEDVKRAAGTYLRSGNLTVARILPWPYGDKNAKPASAGEAMDGIKRSVLENGLRVLVRENHRTPSVSITVAISGGLTAEPEGKNGISNMTAEMMLKGTGTRDEARIKGFVESLGGTVDTFSGLNSFGMNINVLSSSTFEALSLVRELLSDCTFPQDELDKLKVLAAASIKEEDDYIFQTGMNKMRELLFSGSPYSRRYLGTELSVGLLGRDDVAAFYRERSVPENIVISVSGDVDTAKVIDAVSRDFSSLSGRSSTVPSAAFTKTAGTKRTALEMNKEESLVLMGFVTAPLKDPDRYAIEVMGSVLSGTSGRLFEELRNRQSLAYALGCVQKHALDTGFFAFYVATTKDKLEASGIALTGEMNRIRGSEVPEEELESAKRELISSRRIAGQTNSFFSFNTAMDELYGLGAENVYNYEKEIEKVTSQDVKRVAEKYLDPDSYAEVVISSK